MSRTSGPSDEDSEQSEHTVQNALYETYRKVKEYLYGLPPPFGIRLSEHCSHAAHEDVPSDAITSSEDTVALVVSVLPGSTAPNEPKITHQSRPSPPANFGVVVQGSIYRSSYPQVEDLPFLKSLGLRTILTLVPEQISPEYRRFMEDNRIQHFQVHIPANKGSIKINACEMTRALEIVLDRRNHPMLIHCNKGKVSLSAL
jgi:tyrosine-protein phosphatase SIW14